MFLIKRALINHIRIKLKNVVIMVKLYNLKSKSLFIVEEETFINRFAGKATLNTNFEDTSLKLSFKRLNFFRTNPMITNIKIGSTVFIVNIRF